CVSVFFFLLLPSFSLLLPSSLFFFLSPLKNLRLKIFAQKSPARCGKSFPPLAGLFINSARSSAL
ncbi:hypothetical protein, partial [Pyramidobacter piscolens]|uniref:hypothetical protein n=1 Tax=Pyramidobacter piscolens TaxID=638849 RepID=UPI001E50AE50